jgi:ankyrin repeat protein
VNRKRRWEIAAVLLLLLALAPLSIVVGTRLLLPAVLVDSLVEAAAQGKDAQVRRALARGARPDLHTPSGPTALLAAAAAGRRSTVELLLASGASVDAPDRYGRTALMLAAQSDNAAMVRVLLDRGARPDRKDRNGRTARDYAASGGARRASALLGARPPESGR